MADASSSANARSPAKARLGAARHRQPPLARLPARDGRPGRAPDRTAKTRSGPGARRCTASPRASIPTRCTRWPRSSMSRCSKPATPPSANSITCTTHPTARPTPIRAAMSQALIAAARETGIRLTLLPVLYMQRRLRRPPARPNASAASATPSTRSCACSKPCVHARTTRLRVGIALHSLRAVPPDAMRAVLAALPRDTPVHIHIAEQIGEVQDCLALRGARPVEWLLANAAVDRNWTLVHATHLERRGSAGHRRHPAPPSRSARPPKPISATACSRCAPSWKPAAAGASVRIRTSRFRRSRNCAGSNTASAWPRAIATSRVRHRHPTASANRCCTTCSPARSRRPATRSAASTTAQPRTGCCSTAMRRSSPAASRPTPSTAGSSAATARRARSARGRRGSRARGTPSQPGRDRRAFRAGDADLARLTLHARRGRLAAWPTRARPNPGRNACAARSRGP